MDIYAWVHYSCRCIIKGQFGFVLPADAYQSQSADGYFATPVGSSRTQSARLDLSCLEEEVCKYFALGLASSTQRTYQRGNNRFIKFCQEAGATPLPVGEQLLCHFCAYLAKQELKFRTIVYLSAVRHLQISSMGNDPNGKAGVRLFRHSCWKFSYSVSQTGPQLFGGGSVQVFCVGISIVDAAHLPAW